ncbi:MAG: DUF5615 family PIN-like protein [Chloroflexota bacterium]|nr:DUF5615 family PIN-like protein [Chloroflexota bacterium]
MAEFYLDHNVVAEAAVRLRALGHGARTAADIGLERARDHGHFLEAAQRGWILVTYNWKDFRLLHDAWREWPPAWGIDPAPQHAGILVIPAPDRPRGRWLAAEAAERLAAFVAEASPLTNTLHRWFSGAGWVPF